MDRKVLLFFYFNKETELLVTRNNCRIDLEKASQQLTTEKLSVIAPWNLSQHMQSK